MLFNLLSFNLQEHYKINSGLLFVARLEIHNLSLHHSIACQFLAEVRDINIQNDRLRFRKNLVRLGSILAYELSKSLTYEISQIETPLATATAKKIKEHPVLIPILRAGLPFYEGVQEFFDRADAGFIGAYRSTHFSEDGTIVKGYSAMPNLDGKTAVIIDPMLATGNSIIECVEDIARRYKPEKLHVLALLATPAGIANLEKSIKIPFEIWTVAIDEELNDKAYIVPGLGDAGDLAFGPKE